MADTASASKPMNAHHPTDDSHAILKKTRATSCTSCRQVKLKCDLKARYPTACTRCSLNKLECRTNATFKRIPARSRLKDLENQVDKLKRARSIEQVAPASTQTGRQSQEVSVPPSHQATIASSSTSHSRSGPSPAAAIHVNPGTWLSVNDTQIPEFFQLGEAMLAGSDAVELFRTFDQLYYPHFCILEPVTSLFDLARDCQLLFWTVILVATRHHTELCVHYDRIRSAHGQLFGRTCLEAVQSLPDLQAILMMCAWPAPVEAQSKDPSWIYLGMAINAARQIGLDRSTDEVLYGYRWTKHSLSKHPVHVRKLAWLKAFELDVRFCTFYGLIPTLASPQNVRTVKDFCADPEISRKYAACIEVHITTAKYHDFLSNGLTDEITATTMRHFGRALDFVKEQYTDAWTVNTEIDLLDAKLYLYSLRLTSIQGAHLGANIRREHGVPPVKHDIFAHEVLQAARQAAAKLTHLIADLSNELAKSEPVAKHILASHILPGYPKYYSRSAYFAATVLLKYVDSMGNEDNPDAEEARNTFSAAYQSLRKCTASQEHLRAAANLEIAGRAIWHGHAHMEEHVTTRMGASLLYNINWAAHQQRERDEGNAVDVAVTAASTIAGGQSQTVGPEPPRVASNMGQAAGAAANAADMQDLQPGWDNAILDPSSQPVFPFGVWDNALYDDWLSTYTFNDMPRDFDMDFAALGGFDVLKSGGGNSFG